MVRRAAAVHARHRKLRRLREAPDVDRADQLDRYRRPARADHRQRLAADPRLSAAGAGLASARTNGHRARDGCDHAARRRVHLFGRVHQPRHRQLVQRRHREGPRERAAARPDRARHPGARQARRDAAAREPARERRPARPRCRRSTRCAPTARRSSSPSTARTRRSSRPRRSIRRRRCRSTRATKCCFSSGRQQTVRERRPAAGWRLPDHGGHAARDSEQPRRARVRAGRCFPSISARHARGRGAGNLQPVLASCRTCARL